MTERHYAHLSPSYIAETIRANFPTLGIVPKSNVRSIIKRARDSLLKLSGYLGRKCRPYRSRARCRGYSSSKIAATIPARRRFTGFTDEVVAEVTRRGYPCSIVASDASK